MLNATCISMCRCEDGYEGAYCQVSAVSTSELSLLISLSTLLPIAAVLVVIVVIVFTYTRLNRSQEVSNTRTQRRAGYHVSLCRHIMIGFMYVLLRF